MESLLFFAEQQDTDPKKKRKLLEKKMVVDPLALLPPISTVLHSSEESVADSESTLSTEAKRVRRVVSEDDSLAALLLRFEELNERVLEEDPEVYVEKKVRPSKRQRRARALKSGHPGHGFEGPAFTTANE